MSPLPFFKKEKAEIVKPVKEEKLRPEEEIEKKEKLEEREFKPEKRPEVPAPIPSKPVSLAAPEQEIPKPILEKSQTLIEIEQILSENLDEVYQSLPLPQRENFRRQGEETARQIEKIVAQIKINTKKILTLIRSWLLSLVKVIPGINKLFLIQEAKIKTDKILHLAEKKKKRIS